MTLGEEHLMAARTIVREEWVSLLDEVTRQYVGSKARLEVTAQGGAQQVIAEQLSFDGISADLKDGENNVAIMLITADDATLNHNIADAQQLRIDELDGNVARIEVEAADQTITVLTLHAGL
jgi:hypothetical protein